MDTFGKVFLVVGILFFVGALIGFWVLGKRGPRGAVLVVAGLMYFTAHLIPRTEAREVIAVKGILGFTGFVGGILGIVDYVRRRNEPAKSRDSDAIDDK